MQWIDVLWPMMGAASLTLGLIHLTIWFRRREEPAHLMFFLAAASIAVLSIIELLAMRAASPAAHGELVRWGHVPVAVMVLSLIGFVVFRFRVKPGWLGLAAGALRLAALVPNFATGANLNFRSVSEIRPVKLWGGVVVAMPSGDPNPWMLVGQLSNVFFLLFLVRAIMEVRRRPDPIEARRALRVCGSILGFVALAGAWSAVVVLEWLPGPMTVNAAFFCVSVVMSYELAGDVIRTMQLSRRLTLSEVELRNSERRMQLAAQSAGLGLWSWNLSNNESWYSNAARLMLGLGPDDSVDRAYVLARVHPEDHATVLGAHEFALREGGQYAFQFRVLRPHGGVNWIAAEGRIDHSPSGDLPVLAGVVMDITERQQADERFRLVVEGAATALVMIDGDGIVSLANRQAERVFDYGPSELVGRNIGELLPDDLLACTPNDSQEACVDTSIHPQDNRRESLGQRKDGGRVPIEFSLTPIRIGDDLSVLASISDISERRRSEQLASVQRDEVAHLSRVALLGELSGSLAHEINQPLAAILSNAQAAVRFLEMDPPNLGEVREGLAQIVESDKRASEVIRRLRAMLRKDLVNHEQLEVNELVRDAMRLANSHILHRTVDVRLDIAPGLPPVEGDRVQLQQVLLNLMVNACDAMQDSGIGCSLTVRTRATPGPAVEIALIDVGEGIPEEDLERIFDPFVTTKSNGIGLGLAICRTIVQAHKGSLWAINNDRVGATFHLVLPAATPTSMAGSDPGAG